MSNYLRAPSVQTLRNRLPISREQATELRTLLVRWRELPSDKRDWAAEHVLKTADRILNGFGVEPLRDDNSWDSYYGDCIATYVNRGDTYEPTLLYDLIDESWWVGSWGDWYERYESQQDD